MYGRNAKPAVIPQSCMGIISLMMAEHSPKNVTNSTRDRYRKV
jgi:hypothetical protein